MRRRPAQRQLEGAAKLGVHIIASFALDSLGEAFRLAPDDTGALGHGGPALGADIDGETRKGAAAYAGADAVPGK